MEKEARDAYDPLTGEGYTLLGAQVAWSESGVGQRLERGRLLDYWRG